MTEVFQQSPNIVHITIEDADRKTERFVAGRTLVDVIEHIEAALKDPTTPAKPHKARKPRRTKAQMKAEANPDGEGTQIEPPAPGKPKWGETGLGKPAPAAKEEVPF